jgi:hypothetical protein
MDTTYLSGDQAKYPYRSKSYACNSVRQSISMEHDGLVNYKSTEINIDDGIVEGMVLISFQGDIVRRKQEEGK